MGITQYPYRLLSRWIANDPEAWIALGNFETRLIARELPPLVAPIYICGMARAGTTILTEAFARHPQVATHIYRDFPFLFTPYLWNRLLSAFDWIPGGSNPRVRAHQDGIMVTPKSPESMEEMLWMAFFKNLHNEAVPAPLESETKNKERDKKFAAFYRAHIQKLLLARKKKRYASKANYNLTRIPYILNLAPDARFVIVVRSPEALVWSCLQKDALFRAEQQLDPQTLLHMDQSGHFEFGLHRSLIHTGDDAAMTAVREAFASGDNVCGWARYWSALHLFIHQQCRSPETLIVRHEDLSARPQQKMKELWAHCQLGYDDAPLAKASSILHESKPAQIPENIRAIIREETASIAALFGYS